MSVDLLLNILYKNRFKEKWDRVYFTSTITILIRINEKKE